MGYIYKIVNQINNKVYIGKTTHSIEERWKQHKNDAKKQVLYEKRPLYRAIHKYGIDNFSIEEIGNYDNNILSEMEIYWIGYYGSYGEGYNATKGGDGTILFNHDEIVERLKEYPYITRVANEFNCCVDLVSDLAKQYHIKVKSTSEINKEQLSNPIYCIDRNSKEILYHFDSVKDAVTWLISNGVCKTVSPGATSHITDCAKGRRKTAYGYVWSFQ